MNETYDDFLYRLREQRKQLGLSQEQMAQRVHKTQSNYSKVELGLQRLSYEELKYLSYIYWFSRKRKVYRFFRGKNVFGNM